MPQSPDLFEGTIRENIDPTGEHQDADIWTALGQVSLIICCLKYLLTASLLSIGTLEVVRRVVL